MSDLHILPLLGHDLPEISDMPRQEKARVYKDETFLGDPTWRWEHPCRWKGGVLEYSYPLPSWRAAFNMAAQHVKECCK